MRIFKTKWFTRFARQEGISDTTLRKEVEKIANGETGDNLGGYVYKMRLARSGAGKSGGYRVILFFKHNDRLFFDYAYAKSQRDNIGADELRDFKGLAKKFVNYSDQQLAVAIQTGEIKEVRE